jgi:hypothetical protein
MESNLVTDQLFHESPSESLDAKIPGEQMEKTLSPNSEAAEPITNTDLPDPVVDETELAPTADETLPDAEAKDPLPNVEEPQQELTELEKLIQRRTGFWQVNLQEADVKWIKNACNGKFEFTGPNEAFMLMNCFLGFSNAHARMEPINGAERQPCVVQAAAIEGCAYFVNRVSGNNMEAAQRSFRIAMALNPIITEMRSLDTKIQALQEEEKAQKKARKAEAVCQADLPDQIAQ